MQMFNFMSSFSMELRRFRSDKEQVYWLGNSETYREAKFALLKGIKSEKRVFFLNSLKDHFSLKDYSCDNSQTMKRSHPAVKPSPTGPTS